MLSKREVGAVSKDLEKHCDQIFSAVTDDPKQVSIFSGRALIFYLSLGCELN